MPISLRHHIDGAKEPAPIPATEDLLNDLKGRGKLSSCRVLSRSSVQTIYGDLDTLGTNT